jgi:WD40 repeat protein
MKTDTFLKNLIGLLVVFHCHPLNLFPQNNKPLLKINTEMHSNRINKISTDADGKYILTASWDKTAKLWDSNTGNLLKTFHIPIDDGYEGMIYSCAMSPDGKTIAIGGWLGLSWDKSYCIYIFDTETTTLRKRITGLRSATFDLEFSPTGEYLAAALGGNVGIIVFETTRFSIIKTDENYNENTYDLNFDKNGRLASVSLDGFIRLYNSNFKLIEKKSTKVGKQPCSIAFSPDSKLLAVGYNDSHKLQVLDAKNLEPLYEPNVSGANSLDRRLMMVSFSADGSFLIAGGIYRLDKDNILRNQIRIWLNAGKGVFSDYSASQNTIMDIKPLPDGSIIFCSSDPVFGRMNMTGKLLFLRSNEIVKYATEDKSVLLVNDDGSEVSFKPDGIEPFTYNITNKKLIASNSKNPFFKDNYSGIKVSDWNNHTAPKINGKKVSFLQPNEVSLCVDIASNSKNIVFGSSWGITCTNASGIKIWQVPTQGAVWCAKISGDNTIVVATIGDGTLRWYRMSDGKLLLSLLVYSDYKKWISWTSDGFFDYSSGAENLMGWHVNQGKDKEAVFYPASQFYEKYYTPNLGAKILAGINYFEINEKATISNFTHPPVVRVISPHDRSSQNNEQLTVTVQATDKGGGIDEIRLYHNGKLLDGTQRGFIKIEKVGNEVTQKFTLTLVNGENRIKATAFNKQRIESIPSEILINYKAADQVKPNIYILAVGINEYINPRYNLNYAKNDASAFVKALQDGASGIFNKVTESILNDSKATRKGILEEIQKIKSQARPEDVFVFYYAGHGVMSSGSDSEKSEFYLVPHDVTKMYEADVELKAKGVSAKEIGEFSKNIRSQKQLFVLDACQSGGAVQSFAMRGAAEEKAIAQLSRSTGTYFIAASGTEQFATEVSTLGHGIFTYSIIEALKGVCKSQDGRLTVNLLKGCVEDMVPELSKKYKGSPQFPTGYGFGQDFPIVIVKQ